MAEESDSLVDLKQALRVFQVIAEQGEKREGRFYLDGLEADPGIDGYTATLSNGDVSLVIMFHSKFTFDGSSEFAKSQFLAKLKRIDKHYS